MMEVSDKNAWGEFIEEESDTFIINLNKQEMEGVYELILLPKINFYNQLSRKRKTSLNR